VGLIARELEARGIPTVCLTSAWSITQAVNPPRAAYVDYPLGHTAGKPGDRDDQQLILRSALALLNATDSHSAIADLGQIWSVDDSWKDRVMRAKPAEHGNGDAADDRVERFATPQYQMESDRSEAESAPECTGCLWIE